MLALITALVLLDPIAIEANSLRPIPSFRVNCPGCNVTVLKPLTSWGRTFSFQEGPTTPKIEVYAGPLKPGTGKLVLTPSLKKR